MHWLEEQPACAGLFQRLPALFAPCALNSLRIAFEELEERYKELELRYGTGYWVHLLVARLLVGSMVHHSKQKIAS